MPLVPSRLLEKNAAPPPSTSRFALRRQLGTGGFGIVYEAFDRERGIRVALKTLRRATPEAEARLKREFRSLLDLAHPNLVAPYDLVAAPDGLFFTMELVDGVDFLRWVRPGSSGSTETGRMSTTLSSSEGLPESGVRQAGPDSSASLGVLDEQRLRSCLRQLVDALSALHAAGIIHRDLKPSNVLVRPDGRVALLDYGLASALFDEHSLSRRFEGTPAYAAPEQAYGRVVGPAVDFYAAGCMLFQALTGRLPFEGASRAVLLDKETTPAPLVRRLAPDAPEDLATLADTWLRWEPSERLAPRFSPSHHVEGSLLGRERELAVLHDAFRRSRDRGVRVLVEGGGGIGKTSLLQRFCGILGPSVITLRGRCHPRESLAFNAFDEAIDGLARVRLADGSPAVSLLDEASRQALARRFPGLRQRGTPPRGAPPSDRGNSTGSRTASEMELDGFAPGPVGGVEDVRATQALRTLLRRLAAEEPVVILLDDVHWIDAESHELLQALFREPDAPCVLTVLVQRSDIASAMAPQHASLITKLTVERLGDEATLRLAERFLGRSGDDVARLAKASGGHPLLLRELATQSRQRPAGVLESVDDAVHERIDTLLPMAARVLHMLALSTSSLDETDLALALRVDVETVLRVVDELRNKALVRLGNERGKVAFEPSHERVREVAVSRIPRRALADLHGKIADSLARDARPEVLPRVAVHLARAGKPREARVLAERAAEHAEKQLAFGEAADLYRLALTLSEDKSGDVPTTGEVSNEDRRRLRERRLQALLHGHRGADAADEYLRLADDEAPARRDALVLAAARLLLMSGHLDRALPLLSTLLSQSGQSFPRSASEALVHFAKEQGHLALRRRLPLLSSGPKVRLGGELGARVGASESAFGAAPDTARSLATPAAEASLWSIDVASSVSEGLGMIDPLRAAAFQARAFRLALEAGEPTRIAKLRALQAIYDGEGDTLGRRAVLASLPKLRAQSAASGDLQATHFVDVAEAVLLSLEGVRRGNMEGLSLVEERLRTETRGNTWFIQTARLLRFFCMRTYGDFEALRKALPAFLLDAEERRDHYALTSLKRGSSFLFLAADDPREARRNIEGAPWNAGEGVGSFHVQHWLKLDAELEIALYEGEGVRGLLHHHDALEAYQRSWLHRVQRIRTTMLALEGRLALAVGASGHERKRSLRRAERAARALASESHGLCDVRAELLWAGIEGLRGHRDRVVAHLERGLLLADREGAWTLSASARLILSRILLGDRGRYLRRSADELMRRERILAPDAYAAFEIPGC
jgi:eukaryotic-like serine/threonine-protein kinase